MNFLLQMLAVKFGSNRIFSTPVLMMMLAPVPTLAADQYTVELYQTYCKACHSVAAADVPVAFKQNDWDRVMAKGFDQVVDNAISGIGNMPALGSCQECGYQDFEDLVSFMSTAK